MKRFKRIGWVLLIGGLTSAIIWQVWFAPSADRLTSGIHAPRFRVAAETTSITGPLDADGYPDYAEALNQRMNKKVDPENNRVAALLKAVGPRPLGNRPLPTSFYEKLGVEPPPEKGDYLISLKPFLHLDPTLDQDKIEDILESFRQVGDDLPWKKEEHPKIAAWLERNRVPRQTALQALQKPEFYNPIVRRDEGSLLGTFSMDWSVCPELVYQFRCLALQAIGEGSGSAAIEHLLSGLRVARLFPPRLPSDLLHLQGLDRSLFQVAHRLLEKDLLSKNELVTLSAQIEAVIPMPPPAELLDQRLRLWILDRALLTNKLGVLEGDFAIEALPGDRNRHEETARIKKMINLRVLDYDHLLSIINEWLDRTVSDLQISDSRQRREALLKTQTVWQEKLVAALVELEEESKSFFGSMKAGQAMAKFVGLNFANTAITNSHLALYASEDMEERRRLLLTAIALKRFQKETGAYPDSLRALTPRYLKEVPLDLYSGRDPIYVKSPKGGYLLYSIGADGIDSGGGPRTKEVNSDDISVRVPHVRE